MPIVIIIVTSLGFAAGYALGYHKLQRITDNSAQTVFLHHDLDIASISGYQLSYLQNSNVDKASLAMRLHFCESVNNANELINHGALPFPIHIDTQGLEQGREVVKNLQDKKCSASVDALLQSLPKLQARYK
jgi:hypothetical protein